MADQDDELLDAMFGAGSDEATRHNRLKFLENRLLSDASFKALSLRSDAAQRHVRAGFVRRHMMMQKARMEIRIATKDRLEPLDPYSSTHLGIYLNSYYLNLLGALDNLAWAATYEWRR